MRPVRFLTLLGMLMPVVVVADEALPAWKLDAGKSTIQWAINYSGKPVTGSFSIDPRAQIQFDPAHLGQSHVIITSYVDSVKTDDKDAQQNLPGAHWLDAKDYRVAIFESKAFRHIASDNYEAEGTLKLHGAEVKVKFPFSIKIADHHAVVDGSTTIKRLDFGIGKEEGEFAKTDVLADEVKLTIHIEAQDN